jgi:hypothetical protein
MRFGEKMYFGFLSLGQNANLTGNSKSKFFSGLRFGFSEDGRNTFFSKDLQKKWCFGLRSLGRNVNLTESSPNLKFFFEHIFSKDWVTVIV